MSRFSECLKFVLDQEGRTGKEAPGDLDTCWGVTQPVYSAWRKRHNLPDRDVDEGTEAEFRQIYLSDYWMSAKCGSLSAPLDLLHMDTAVNCGVDTANKILQTALGLSQIDGIVGPQTLGAVARANLRVVYGRYCNLRISRYMTLAMLDPKYTKYLGGWLRRVGRLLQRA